jgi:5,10-methylene-tetrahydrofolate dehydrogenase/methenyl tetrahydrofolate cyclohydrolase
VRGKVQLRTSHTSEAVVTTSNSTCKSRLTILGNSHQDLGGKTVAVIGASRSLRDIHVTHT